MSYPIDDIAHSPRPSQFSYLAARQRVEKVLAQLPAAGGAVQEFCINSICPSQTF